MYRLSRLSSPLILSLLLSLIISINVSSPQSIQQEISLTLVGQWETNSSALCSQALSDAQKTEDGYAQVIIVNSIPGCDPAADASGTTNAADVIGHGIVKAFIGPLCYDEFKEITRLSYFWQRGVIGRLVSRVEMLNTVISLISPAITNNDVYPIMRILYDYLQINNIIHVTSYITINENADKVDQMIEAVSQRIITSTQLLIIGDDFVDLYGVLQKLDLHKLSMRSFIVILVAPNGLFKIIYNESLRKYLVSANVLTLSPAIHPTENLVDKFSPIINTTFQTSMMNEYIALYSACYAYSVARKRYDSDIVDNYYRTFSGIQYTNILGAHRFDQNGVILRDYEFSVLRSDLKGNETLILFVKSEYSDTCSAPYACFTVKSEALNDAEYWNQMKSKSVETCLMQGTCSNNWYSWLIGGTVLLLVIFVFVLIYLRRKNRINMYRMLWKINRENLKIIDNRGPGSKMTKPTGNETLATKRRAITSYALMGSIKAEFLSYRQYKRIRWTKQELRHLCELKAINHDNITKFIGLNCNDSANLHILYGLIERATLEDFVYDSDFSLDATFKSAFARDILRGLQYIHKSPIVAHGQLSVQTCMIDANWVLKLTNFGIASMVHKFINDGTLQCTTSVNLEVYCLHAPELLKEISHTVTTNMPRGTQKGDIYSLGMILYQMVYRVQPYPKSSSAQELLAGIINRHMKPERLEVSEEEGKLVDCIMTCLDEPEKRPKAREIANTISVVYASAKGNLVDQMIRMNEKYALNLEKLVQERTALLVAAQEQTDRLLNEMLPKSVAQVLKTGGTIPPRSYDSATVLFAQLCDFPVLVGKSGPDDVINFLNDVFDKFDDIIQKHDAYKVETTGETYMVASGVPTENEGRHVFEIAEISLEIREAAMSYVVEHCPSFKVRARIGFHAGPIAAGIIGIRSPRYCLFGDTVNFASRMQSNCPPNQIQTSEVTAELIMMQSKDYSLVQRGIVYVKGKGDVNCYWLNEHLHEANGKEATEAAAELTVPQSVNSADARPKTRQRTADQTATPLPQVHTPLPKSPLLILNNHELE